MTKIYESSTLLTEAELNEAFRSMPTISLAEQARIQRLRDVVRDLEGEIAQGHAIDIASNLSATAYEKLRQALADASIRF